jgi:hypothetical protein
VPGHIASVFAALALKLAVIATTLTEMAFIICLALIIFPK